MKRALILVPIIALTGLVLSASGIGSIAKQQGSISVRTENFPRPPYSGATYYIYERGDQVICTKLEVCNKYGQCQVTYKKGTFKDPTDVETDEPYGKTDAVVIPANKLRKHVCLMKYKLVR